MTSALKSVHGNPTSVEVGSAWVQLPGGAYWCGGSSVVERLVASAAGRSGVRNLPSAMTSRWSSTLLQERNGLTLSPVRSGIGHRRAFLPVAPRKALVGSCSGTEVRVLPGTQAGIAQLVERRGLRSPEVGGSKPSTRIFVCDSIAGDCTLVCETASHRS